MAWKNIPWVYSDMPNLALISAGVVTEHPENPTFGQNCVCLLSRDNSIHQLGEVKFGMA